VVLLRASLCWGLPLLHRRRKGAGVPSFPRARTGTFNPNLEYLNPRPLFCLPSRLSPLCSVPISTLAFSGDTYWQAGAPDLVVPGGRVLTESQQLSLYYESVSAWYAMLILCQACHVWVCKTRYSSIFGHSLADNIVTIYGVVAAIFVMLAVVYIPWLQPIFYTGSLRGVVWPIFLCFAGFILAYTEGIKWAARHRPHWRVVKWLAW